MSRPRHAWLAVLLGAAPHLVLWVIVRAVGEWPFAATDVSAVPYALYGGPELIIVPAGCVIVAAVAAVRRTRPWAFWLLLGTFGGATFVFLTAAAEATRQVSL